jgi:ABC-type maltose transport system permease subunit
MIFITLMLPVEVRILPTYQVISDLGMLNTYAGLTVPLIASATATFLFRQFFLTVPDELVETIAVCGPRDEIAGRIVARLDGLSTHVGLVNSRQPDPSWFADIVADLRAAQANP